MKIDYVYKQCQLTRSDSFVGNFKITWLKKPMNWYLREDSDWDDVNKHIARYPLDIQIILLKIGYSQL